MSSKKEAQLSPEQEALWSERVQTLLKIEEEYNKKWTDEKIYEADAPKEASSDEHYMITFPYPYMNGRLHLGHLFTLTKAEFAARYQRMKGKKVLFPFGFHCTGMPIKASADKLKLELETGQAVKTGGALKSKAASKVDTSKSQFDIMKMMDVPENEIPEFANPQKWLEYFPPLGMKDLQFFGACIDWRRSFITTEVNPYYDAFVKWQFTHLHQQGLVEYGKRPTIYSLKDQQPCMDHDRSSGEGLQPQEYVLIKIQLQNPAEVSTQFPANLPVYLLAATLRAETMIGQTNFWVKPGAKYDVVMNKAGTEVWVSGHRSVRNLAAQDLIQSPEPLFELEANSILGKLGTHKHVAHPIRALPMPSISMTKGTGIVTSVPSDAPADLAAIDDLKRDDKLRAKYNVEAEWLNFEIIRVIDTVQYGDFAAQKCLEIVKYNPNSKKEAEKQQALTDAKELCYKEGFYKGTMKFGPFQGEKVQIAKDKMKALMIEDNSALSYYEPEGEIISRSGDECVVVFCDQWYLLYGKEDWKQKVVDHFNVKVDCFHPETREKFLKCFDWLGPWACSRQFGLGTHMPFSQEFLIDSLSDSTVYTSYYTIAHLLQGNLDGSKMGIAQIPPEKITNEFFDCIFLNGPTPKEFADNPAILDVFKREFNFWYPVNCRVSGKDLVTNHLTMYLYNHAAIFPAEKWPIGIRANGHLKLNNRKMSKHDGNFYTVVDAINKFSSSALRIALADGGDAADDANFSDDVAKSILSRLMSFIDFIKVVPANMRTEKSGFADELLDARISKSIIDSDAAYSKMQFKLALKASLYDLQIFWAEYTNSVDTICAPLRERYIDTLLKLITPLAPHYTDYVWQQVLGNKTSIINEKYPQPTEYNPQIFFMDRFISKTMDQIRYKIKALAKKINCQDCAVFLKNSYNPAQIAILDVLLKNYNKETNSFNDEGITESIKQDPILSKTEQKEYMPELKFLKESVPEFGTFLLDHTPSINQFDLLKLNEARIAKQLHLTSIQIITEPTPDSPLWDEKAFNDAKVYQAQANLTGPAKAPAQKGGKK